MDMYINAVRMSSVCPAEYSWGLVIGTPAPVKVRQLIH